MQRHHAAAAIAAAWASGALLLSILLLLGCLPWWWRLGCGALLEGGQEGIEALVQPSRQFTRVMQRLATTC
jgi:hypothetical protein